MRNENWTFDQLCLLAQPLRHRLRHEPGELLLKEINQIGPVRTRLGGKWGNLRCWLGVDGHEGLPKQAILDGVVMNFFVSNHEGFETYCNKIRRRQGFVRHVTRIEDFWKQPIRRGGGAQNVHGQGT